MKIEDFPIAEALMRKRDELQNIINGLKCIEVSKAVSDPVTVRIAQGNYNEISFTDYGCPDLVAEIHDIVLKHYEKDLRKVTNKILAL